MALPSRHGELARAQFWELIPLTAEEGKAPASDAASVLRKLGKAARNAVLLSRRDYRLMVVPRPDLSPEELEQGLRWNIAPLLDYPPEDIALQMAPIPSREHLPEREEHIYVVCAQRSLLEGRALSYRSLGINPNVIDIREMAQRNVAVACSAGEGVGLLSHAGDGFLLTFTFAGELYLDRFIEAPLETLQEPGSARVAQCLSEISHQLSRSLDFLARNLPFVKVVRVLVGPTLIPLGLHEFLAREQPVTVEPLELEDIFDFSEVPALREPSNQARALLSLGATLRGTQR